MCILRSSGLSGSYILWEKKQECMVMTNLASHVGSVDEHIGVVLGLVGTHARGAIIHIGVVGIYIAHHSVMPLHQQCNINNT